MALVREVIAFSIWAYIYIEGVWITVHQYRLCFKIGYYFGRGRKCHSRNDDFISLQSPPLPPSAKCSAAVHEFTATCVGASQHRFRELFFKLLNF